MVYDHATPVPSKLLLKGDVKVANKEMCPPIPTAVFGPTCDGLDQMCNPETTLLER